MLVSVLTGTTCDVSEQDVGETTGHPRDINLNWFILLSGTYLISLSKCLQRWMKNDCLHPVFDPFEVKPTSHPDTFCSMIASTVFWITVIVIILCCRYIILQQIMTDFACFIFQESMFANIHTRKPASQVRSRKYLFKPRANWTSPPATLLYGCDCRQTVMQFVVTVVRGKGEERLPKGSSAAEWSER